MKQFTLNVDLKDPCDGERRVPALHLSVPVLGLSRVGLSPAVGGGHFSVTLQADNRCRYVSWRRKKLYLLFAKHRYLAKIFALVVRNDIADKLYSLNDKPSTVQVIAMTSGCPASVTRRPSLWKNTRSTFCLPSGSTDSARPLPNGERDSAPTRQSRTTDSGHRLPNRSKDSARTQPNWTGDRIPSQPNESKDSARHLQRVNKNSAQSQASRSKPSAEFC
ncbi:hypothetical protein WMY93_026242 [Mugilogobius chulae]|uniref:Uncharacterized protein n=1 Tax=Mugilogobius chulae TaxID=88201 RepID=A0AAW0MX09_9GOBI